MSGQDKNTILTEELTDMNDEKVAAQSMQVGEARQWWKSGKAKQGAQKQLHVSLLTPCHYIVSLAESAPAQSRWKIEGALAEMTRWCYCRLYIWFTVLRQCTLYPQHVDHVTPHALYNDGTCKNCVGSTHILCKTLNRTTIALQLR